MLCRKQCINETEEFDFLKDIVANVDDASHTNTSAAPVAEENKPTISIEEAPHNDTLENEEISEDKGLNHKCSISTMLNDEPVTPPQVKSKNTKSKLTNQATSPESAVDESYEQVK